MEQITCNRCGSVDDYHTVPSGPHNKAICNSCNRYIKFVSKAQIRAKEILGQPEEKPLSYDYLHKLGLSYIDDCFYINPAMRLCFDNKVWRVEFKEGNAWNWYATMTTELEVTLLNQILNKQNGSTKECREALSAL